MKNNYRFFRSVLLIAFLSLFALSLIGQNNRYYVLQYLKVPPVQENEYLQLEMDVWKKMHQARIDAGVLDGWHLYRVISPQGTQTDYDFITVLIYNNPEKLAGHFENYGVDYTQVLSSDEIAAALKTPEIRDLVYEEVWQTIDGLQAPDSDQMFRFQRFNAMKTNPNQDDQNYVSIEQNYWKPVHQQRIKMGSMYGWGLYQMIIPGGTEREYTWATVDYFDRFIDIMNDDENTKLFDKIHRKNAVKYLEETVQSRDLLRTEIRELIDYINVTNL